MSCCSTFAPLNGKAPRLITTREGSINEGAGLRCPVDRTFERKIILIKPDVGEPGGPAEIILVSQAPVGLHIEVRSGNRGQRCIPNGRAIAHEVGRASLKPLLFLCIARAQNDLELVAQFQIEIAENSKCFVIYRQNSAIRCKAVGNLVRRIAARNTRGHGAQEADDRNVVIESDSPVPNLVDAKIGADQPRRRTVLSGQSQFLRKGIDIADSIATRGFEVEACLVGYLFPIEMIETGQRNDLVAVVEIKFGPTGYSLKICTDAEGRAGKAVCERGRVRIALRRPVGVAARFASDNRVEAERISERSLLRPVEDRLGRLRIRTIAPEASRQCDAN